MTSVLNNDISLVVQLDQASRFQEQTHLLTSRCWDLCVDKLETRLGSRTETCLKNCVERFIDTSNFITNRLEKSLSEQTALESSFD